MRLFGSILAFGSLLLRLFTCGMTLVICAPANAQSPIQLPEVNPDTLSTLHFPEVSIPTSAYGPGERLEYTFRYGFVHAAEAQIELKAAGRGPNGPQWLIDARGRSTGTFSWFFKVDDRYRTTIDAATGYPLHFIRDVKEGGYTIDQDYRFDWSTQSVRTLTSKRGNPVKKYVFQLPGPTHDMISSIFALRNLDFDNLQAGDTARVPLFMDEEWLELEVVYSGKVEQKVNGEKWPCLLFHPVIQTGRIWRNPDDLSVYISDDANHIPLLAQSNILFGTIQMELTHASGLRNPSSRRD